MADIRDVEITMTNIKNVDFEANKLKNKDEKYVEIFPSTYKLRIYDRGVGDMKTYMVPVIELIPDQHVIIMGVEDYYILKID